MLPPAGVINRNIEDEEEAHELPYLIASYWIPKTIETGQIAQRTVRLWSSEPEVYGGYATSRPKEEESISNTGSHSSPFDPEWISDSKAKRTERGVEAGRRQGDNKESWNFTTASLPASVRCGRVSLELGKESWAWEPWVRHIVRHHLLHWV